MKKSKGLVAREAPFVSIEEDARLMGMKVRHEGMSQQKAQAIVNEAKKCFLEASIMPKGRGRYNVLLIVELEPKEFVPVPLPGKATLDEHGAKQNNHIVTDGYDWIAEHREAVFIIENRSQWQAFQMLYLNMDEIQEEQQRQAEDWRELARRFEERAGVSFDAFLKSMKTKVVMGGDRLLEDIPA